MGCWNGTCMISNLPIIQGEKIKLMFLQKKFNEPKILGKSGYVYSTDLLSPAFLAISGEYNNYGSIDNIVEDWNFELIQNILYKRFGDRIYTERSKNEIIKWGLLDLIEGIERGNPQYSHPIVPELRNCDLSFVMIRQDVWDLCVDIQKKSKDYWNPKRKSGDPDTIPYYLSGEDWGEYQWNNFVEKIKTVYKTPEEQLKAEIRSDPFDYVFTTSTGDRTPLIDMWNYKILCKERKDDDIFLNDVKTKWFEHHMIYDCVSNLRKGWMIQPGSGSQDQDWSYNKDFYCGLTRICDNKLNEDF